MENERDWKDELLRDSKGMLLCTMPNIAAILRNDEKLKNIVFNEMKNCVDTVGETPWGRHHDGWRGTDLACLELYLEDQYDLYAPKKCKDALQAFLSAERRYHPIRDYLGALKWDGMERLDTILINYLGAEDTPYVRAVTRKSFTAAVARVYEPGIKYDCMLVLCGDQGIGKSTLFAKLGGKWYSDSMTIADMKDKTAAEKLQGIWIMELSELAGLKKMDVETVKSFLSRTDDQYRVPYGQYVEMHPRTGIIAGTTNAVNGFLRDITGNRRFWPVLLKGRDPKRIWEMTDKDVGQIWAEAAVRYREGEKLFLEGAVEEMAVEQQRIAMESDPRQGIISEYLGALKRDRICLMEIWCECLQQKRENMRKRDAYELEGILRQIGGWEAYPGNATGKARIPGYGVQKAFVRSGS
ncbi:MAG: hypothetical protein J6N53_02875 [Lachnospiraceae bacterium]|nr:hypothetical protein [Lachnospiraceae bacterium]MBO6297766.1 hypothetical protein [Lachnospiraceae bacterium]MBP3297646.1 hypothetical protein [Lachnospiraceae bacterium]